MDYIFNHNPGRTNDYYLVMGGLEARMLKESALAASQLINNKRLQVDFIKNTSLLIDSKMEMLSGGYSEASKKEALAHLKDVSQWKYNRVTSSLRPVTGSINNNDFQWLCENHNYRTNQY